MRGSGATTAVTNQMLVESLVESGFDMILPSVCVDDFIAKRGKVVLF